MTLPDAATLAASPLHVVVRDFPETLAAFRRAGIDLPARGGETFAAATGGEAAAIYHALRHATAWRALAQPGPCDAAAAHAATQRAHAAREEGATT